MKKTTRIAGALLAAASLFCSFGSMSAFAAEAEPATVSVPTVCPDYVPLSDDTISILPADDCTLTAKIVQHSPERENLVLFDSKIDMKKGVYYEFAAEPGSYTV